MSIEELKTEDFSFPKGVSTPTVNMQSCILYGLPKCGKTTALSLLKDCLIIDTENGSDKISGHIKKVPMDRGPVGRMQWLNKFAVELLKAGKPYDYVALDSFSEINDWSEWSGTFRYMNSIMGCSFNREKDENEKPIKRGIMLKPTDDDYESVHNVPEGFGYRWSREDTLRVFEKYSRVAKKCIFYVCHVEDKYVGQKENTDMVIPKQLALTGKLRNILPRKVDAIGYIYNEDGVININFTGNEERVGGNRCLHLGGYNGILDWNKIFI